jgi:AraC family transcriptional regulator
VIAVLAKIAAELERALTEREINGTSGQLRSHRLARGDGWAVEDVICTSDPRDRSFEEIHDCFRIAIVCAGTFQYRTDCRRRELMTPGALLLGNAGHGFECGHEHGAGDRCLSFGYAPRLFERLLADAGGSGTLGFSAARVPPIRQMVPVVSRALGALVEPGPRRTGPSWEEVGIALAARVIQLTGRTPTRSATLLNAEARITRVVRAIDRNPAADLTLRDMADEARLSVYHFLRTFERAVGVTPHQYLRRARLRDAAMRLGIGRTRILDIALDCGFGDASTFNRAFRAEFGVSPRGYTAASKR